MPDLDVAPTGTVRGMRTSGGCVEVAITGAEVAVRDSKRPDVPALTFTADEWRVFIDGVKRGEFDVPAHAPSSGLPSDHGH
jgi:hypothetical protein